MLIVKQKTEHSKKIGAIFSPVQSRYFTMSWLNSSWVDGGV